MLKHIDLFSSVLTHAKRNCRHPSQPRRKLRFTDQISFNHIAEMDGWFDDITSEH